MNGITITVNLGNYERFEERMKNFVRSQAKIIAAKTAISSILELTREGVDANGVFFRPYAPITVQERRNLGLRTDIVNLFVTGKMLGSLGSNGGPDGLVTFSPSQVDKAVDNLILGRDFIGPGPQMLKAVKADLEVEMQKLC